MINENVAGFILYDSTITFSNVTIYLYKYGFCLAVSYAFDKSFIHRTFDTSTFFLQTSIIMVNMYNGFTDNVLLSIKARCHYSQVALHKMTMKDHLKTQHKICKWLFKFFIEISKRFSECPRNNLILVREQYLHAAKSNESGLQMWTDELLLTSVMTQPLSLYF